LNFLNYVFINLIIIKKLSLIIVFLSLTQLFVKAQTLVQDSLAIRKTVLNYIEGWDNGDTIRMTKALHTKLAKRGIVPSQNGNGTDLVRANYTEMISWTASRKNLPKENSGKIVIKIYEIGKNIADVKCVSKEYIDYLHLARIDNQWKILNAIWEFNEKK